MNSRDAILSSLRAQRNVSVQLPDYHFAATCPEPPRQFAESLETVGGNCIAVADLEALEGAFGDLDVYRNAKKTLSLVTGIGGNVDAEQLTDPHQLEDLDLAILPGVFGVAENGAVWLDMNCLGPHRAVFVIPQHLALVINSDQIVPTMHDAYARLTLNDHDFGVFISGPSKTADIEQSLVIGAHGARSCTVFLVDS